MANLSRSTLLGSVGLATAAAASRPRRARAATTITAVERLTTPYQEPLRAARRDQLGRC